MSILSAIFHVALKLWPCQSYHSNSALQAVYKSNTSAKASKMRLHALGGTSPTHAFAGKGARSKSRAAILKGECFFFWGGGEMAQERITQVNQEQKPYTDSITIKNTGDLVPTTTSACFYYTRARTQRQRNMTRPSASVRQPPQPYSSSLPASCTASTRISGSGDGGPGKVKLMTLLGQSSTPLSPESGFWLARCSVRTTATCCC